MVKNFKFRAIISGFLLISTVLAWSQERDQNRVRVIEPDSQTAASGAAIIDTEKFELGFYFGNLSVEDFGSDVVTGLELSYHINADWMVQANYGLATIDRAAFETSQLQFLADADRDFEYFAVVGGYRFMRGRSFFGARQKYHTDLYVLTGLEQVSFADNSEVGLAFGLSYRIVFKDWLTTNIDFREHFFDREFIGDNKMTLNTELRLGFNFLF